MEINLLRSGEYYVLWLFVIYVVYKILRTK